MSRPVPQDFACPHCGKVSSVKVWDSLDAQANPIEKEQLITGELFQFSCPECGEKTVLNYPCLYVDPERAVRIYYVPDVDSVPEVVAMLEGVASKLAASPEAERDERMRVVTALNELREKATVFDDDLDDRVIEVLKVLFIEYLEQHWGMAGDEVSAVYYTGRDDNGDLMLFVVADKPQVASAPISLYEQLEDEILFDQMAVGSKFIIDSAWANAVLIRQQFAQEAAGQEGA